MKSVEEIVECKVANNPVLKDKAMDCYIEEIVVYVKNYLNYNQEEELPQELNYTVANMIVDFAMYYEDAFYSGNNQAGGSSSASQANGIQSVSIGDTTISFKSSDSASYSQAHSPSTFIDGMVLSYSNILNKFRRVIW